MEMKESQIEVSNEAFIQKKVESF